MKKISSSMTAFHKKVFPTIWFGFLAVFAVVALPGVMAKGDVLFLIFPVIMAVFGYVIMKKLVFGLADEVFDASECLVVKNRGSEIRIPLSDIINVSVSTQ